MAPRALRCSSTRPLHALRFLVIALLCRGPSELGKTLPKLPREDKVQLRLQDAVGSTGRERSRQHPGQCNRSARTRSNRSCDLLTKAAVLETDAAAGDSVPDEGMGRSQNNEAIDGWRPVDQGGAGDCGYRAIAQARHWLLSQACQREAAWLRAQVVQYVLTHKERFIEFLAQDRD